MLYEPLRWVREVLGINLSPGQETNFMGRLLVDASLAKRPELHLHIPSGEPEADDPVPRLELTSKVRFEVQEAHVMPFGGAAVPLKGLLSCSFSPVRPAVNDFPITAQRTHIRTKKRNRRLWRRERRHELRRSCRQLARAARNATIWERVDRGDVRACPLHP